MRAAILALLLFVSAQPAFAQRPFDSAAQGAASRVEGKYDLTTTSKVVRVTDPQISPDGRAIAVLVGRVNYDENRIDTDLVLVDPATRAQRVLVKGRRAVSAPRWTPDGSQVAFLAQVDGKTQVFAAKAAGGEPWQVTKSPTTVINFAVRPDGKSVAYTATDEEPVREGDARFNKSFEVTRSSYLATDIPRPVHLWLAPIDGSPARRLTSGPWTLPAPYPPGPPPPAPSWSADGKTLAFIKIPSVHSGERGESTIHLLDVDGGSMRQLTTRPRGEQQPTFSPDGQWIAYWRSGPSGIGIQVAPVTGGFGDVVEDGLDRNILRAVWMPDSRSLILAANDHTTTGIWHMPLGAKPQRIEMGSLVANANFGLDASVSRGGRIAITASESQRPTELYLLENVTSAPRRLTDFNAHIAALQLGKSETIEWTGPDGFTMDGVVTYPPDFQQGRQYPLVLYIHGGPRSTSKAAFSTRAQLLAAQGWIVFEPNYRGSDNHGGKFMNAIGGDAGAGPGRDVMSGIEQLKTRGVIDGQRMAVSGWSYGGYMTTWMIGNYPDVFKAAVAGAPVTDQLAQYTLSDGNSGRGMGGAASPYTNEDRMKAFLAQSPLTFAPKVKTPTLLLALTGDYRVPIPQVYAYYHALRDNKVKVQFIAYPLPGHNPQDPVHQRDVDRRWVEWIKTHLDAAVKSTTDGQDR